MTYIDLDYAIFIHNTIVRTTGGLLGYSSNIDRFESVLIHVQDDNYYPTFLDKLTHLIFCAIKFHPFLDGNKRFAIGLGERFLTINHYSYASGRFIEEMENLVILVASNLITKEALAEYLDFIICDYEFTEYMKLNLINALHEYAKCTDL